LDLKGNIPSFIHITDGSVHDVNVLDLFVPEAGAFYIMDRGYLDFDREYTCIQTQPLGYGNSTSSFGAFNVILKPKMKAGERQTIRYVIYCHAAAPSIEALQQAAPR